MRVWVQEGAFVVDGIDVDDKKMLHTLLFSRKQLVYCVADREFVIKISGLLLKNNIPYSDTDKKGCFTFLLGKNFRLVSMSVHVGEKLTFVNVSDIVKGGSIEKTRKAFPYGYEDVFRFAERIGYDKNTVGAYSQNDYINSLPQKMQTYKHRFPTLTSECSGDIEEAFFNGFNWCKQIGEFGEGMSADANSMYPWGMKQLMPYGTPRHYVGKYVKDDHMPLHVDKITFYAKLKDKGCPILPEQHRMRLLIDDETHVVETDGFVTMWLSDVDWQTVNENYDTQVYEYCEGYKFKASRHLFDGFIDKWYGLKSSDDIQMSYFAKKVLVIFYGKFVSHAYDRTYVPRLRDDGIVDLVVVKKESVNSLRYPPVAVWTTAYSRRRLTRVIRWNYDRFLLCVTDGASFVGRGKLKGVVLSSRIGDFKNDYFFKSIRVLGARKYCQKLDDDSIHEVTASISVRQRISYDDFYQGYRVQTKSGHWVRL